MFPDRPQDSVGFNSTILISYFKPQYIIDTHYNQLCSDKGFRNINHRKGMYCIRENL